MIIYNPKLLYIAFPIFCVIYVLISTLIGSRFRTDPHVLAISFPIINPLTWVLIGISSLITSHLTLTVTNCKYKDIRGLFRSVFSIIFSTSLFLILPIFMFGYIPFPIFFAIYSIGDVNFIGILILIALYLITFSVSYSSIFSNIKIPYGIINILLFYISIIFLTYLIFGIVYV